MDRWREGGRQGEREGGWEGERKRHSDLKWERRGGGGGGGGGRKEMARHQAEEDVILFKLYTNLSTLAVLL